jgi:hypothetical protein
MSDHAIPAQTPLPLRTAVGIVAAGLKLRWGRSLVTITGIALGIAFLMATLTSHVLDRGVADEDVRREATSRAYGILLGETGSLHERRVAVIATAPLSDAEERLLARIAADAPRAFSQAPGTHLPPGLLRRLDPVSPHFSQGASVILVLGTGPLPALEWLSTLAAARRPLVAFTHARPTPFPPQARVVALSRDPSAEERSARAAEALQARTRTRWTVVVSLLVTVMGIANALLMSVTERFREIGTLRCLGALSSFVRTLFLLEATFSGAVGGLAGVLGGAIFSLLSHAIGYGIPLVARVLAQGTGALVLWGLGAFVASLILSIGAALYPASVAARLVPASALRCSVWRVISPPGRAPG